MSTRLDDESSRVARGHFMLGDGSSVEALRGDGLAYPCEVTAIIDDHYAVTFEDGTSHIVNRVFPTMEPNA